MSSEFGRTRVMHYKHVVMIVFGLSIMGWCLSDAWRGLHLTKFGPIEFSKAPAGFLMLTSIQFAVGLSLTLDPEAMTVFTTQSHGLSLVLLYMFSSAIMYLAAVWSQKLKGNLGKNSTM